MFYQQRSCGVWNKIDVCIHGSAQRMHDVGAVVRKYSRTLFQGRVVGKAQGMSATMLLACIPTTSRWWLRDQ